MSHFIANIDEANGRVNALEQQLGLPRSEFIDNLDRANARIAELEGRAAKPTTAKPAAATGGNLVALQARRNQLCAALGIDPKFQSACKTPAEYEASIAKLEARQKAQQTAPTAPVVQPKPVTATVAATMTRFKTGTTRGLERAIGAATLRDNP